MNKIIAFTLLMVSSASVFAVCPANLNGGWSGSVVKTNGTLAVTQDGSGSGNGFPTPLPESTTNGTLTGTIAGNAFTTLYYVQSEAGPFGGIQEDTKTSVLPLTYDRTSCRGTIKTDEYVINFTVSNGGKTIKGVSYKQDKGNFGQIQLVSGETALWVLEKQ